MSCNLSKIGRRELDKTFCCTSTMLHYLVLLYLASSGLCTCPNGYETLGNGDCYKTMTTPSLQRDAEAFCEREGGTLVQPLNAFVDAKLRSDATNGSTNLWLGLTCLGNTTTSCTYSNGDMVTPNSYTNFYPDHPNAVVGHCVFLSISGAQNGKWVSGNCTEKNLGFGCQRTAESMLPNYVPKCGSSYQEFNGFCYKRIPPTTPEAGELACELECGHLTSIHSQQENDFIYNSFVAPDWASIYIGLEFTNNREYEWTDGSTLPLEDYSNFAGDSFDDCYVCCVSMEYYPGKWIKDGVCDRKYFSVCKRERVRPCLSVQPSIVPFFPRPSLCPATYNLSEDGNIYSPGYPANYLFGVECEYVFTAPPGFVVFFNLDDDLFDDASNISLYNSVRDTVPFLNRVVYGNGFSWTYYASTTSTMKVKFTSGSSNITFWSAHLHSVDIRSSGCNQGILKTPGVITSPYEDPNNTYYPSLYNCSYQLKAPSNQRVSLTFTEFFTMVDGTSGYDYVFVFDGPDSKSPLLGNFSGYHPEQIPSIVSSTNQMLVSFVTDDFRGGGYFKANFSAV